MSTGPTDDEILASLTPDPATTPPTPVSSPSTSLVVSPRVRGCLEFVAVAIVAAILAGGFVAWRLGGSDAGPPTADAVTLGRNFAPILAGTLADGFDAGAKALESGKSMAEADAALKAEFARGRNAAFDQHVGQAIHDLQPDGSEITDNAKRNAMIDLFTGFAKGLRESR